jgi:hypothetical protein
MGLNEFAQIALFAEFHYYIDVVHGMADLIAINNVVVTNC